MLKRDSEKLSNRTDNCKCRGNPPSAAMATQEQVQEALQRFQAQEARIVALETRKQRGEVWIGFVNFVGRRLTVDFSGVR